MFSALSHNITGGKEFTLWISIFPASTSFSPARHNKKVESPLSVKTFFFFIATWKANGLSIEKEEETAVPDGGKKAGGIWIICWPISQDQYASCQSVLPQPTHLCLAKSFRHRDSEVYNFNSNLDLDKTAWKGLQIAIFGWPPKVTCVQYLREVWQISRIVLLGDDWFR